MKWRKEDLEKYVQAKEYIDTILLPIIPFQLADDAESEKHAFQQEVMGIFGSEIEQELSGRVMLIPSYYYLKEGNKEVEVQRLNDWIAEAKDQPFQHIILLTFDATWKKYEKELDGNLLWLPGLHGADLRTKETQGIIRDQVKQLTEIIRSYWQ